MSDFNSLCDEALVMISTNERLLEEKKIDFGLLMATHQKIIEAIRLLKVDRHD